LPIENSWSLRYTWSVYLEYWLDTKLHFYCKQILPFLSFSFCLIHFVYYSFAFPILFPFFLFLHCANVGALSFDSIQRIHKRTEVKEVSLYQRTVSIDLSVIKMAIRFFYFACVSI